MKVYQRSIEGINREILCRENRIRQRKQWYLDPVGMAEHSFTMAGFYFEGYRIMKEIERLKKIREDLVLCIDKNL